MRVQSKRLITFLGLFSFLLFGCSRPWQETIRYGETTKEQFEETIDFEEKLGLAIVKVKIENVEYNFLFDTGAPFAISEEIQARHNYKLLSSGGFRDSDNLKINVDYVRVPSTFIGAQEFTNQTAVVANFKNNPIIGCLEIDGILGSNLMRHCNWRIDFSERKMKLFTTPVEFDPSSQFELPFKASNQYDVKIDFKIGRATITNIKMDYGSNGAISVPNKIYNTLVERKIVNTLAIERGRSQSGLVGKAIEKDKAYAIADSVIFGELFQPDITVRSGSSGLLGTKVLSKYVVTIDWDSQRLLFEKQNSQQQTDMAYGFKLGINTEEKVYVLSVIEPSHAWESGIRSGLFVERYANMQFQTTSDYCEYVFYDNQMGSALEVSVIDSAGVTKDLSIKPFNLKSLK